MNSVQIHSLMLLKEVEPFELRRSVVKYNLGDGTRLSWQGGN